MTKPQRLYRDHDPRVRRLLARALGCAALVVLSALAAAGARVQQVHLAYRLDALHGEHDRLGGVIRQLEIEVATLRSPGRLDSRARQLGMTSPAQDQIRLAREYVPSGTGLAADLSLRADAGGTPGSRTRRAP
ncbi:MAG: cell division protein FtsL [Candidatus Rokubacteria bacterium]|nr:cell division protein FtsL [Candidatus Rokubacteria bacterium]